jgi:endonuclease YncB( thermonuclease family)
MAPVLARTPLPAFAPGAAVQLGDVIDGETLALADGRTLRLAEIEVPGPATRGEAEMAARARDALAKLVSGKPLELRYGGAQTDRHGRVVAQLFAGGRWVQRELVRRGLARVQGAADQRIGVTALLATEAAARKARRGIWRRRFFAVRAPDEAARDAGSFQIVEGVVTDTAPVGGGVRVNFGPDWHTAFSLRIGGEALKLCRAAGLDPLKLTGARLRVRGYIDGTRRPTIEVTFPEQIERL